MLVGHAHDERVRVTRRDDDVFANGAYWTPYGASLADGLLVGVSERQEFPTRPIDIFPFSSSRPRGHSVVTGGIASKSWRLTLADNAFTLVTARADRKREFKFMPRPETVLFGPPG